MAALTLFSYRSGHSRLHRLDVRCKILALLCISIASLNAGVASLTLLSFLGIALVVDCRLALGTFFREIRFFLIFMPIILVARSFSAAGTKIIQIYFVTLSLQGFLEGLMFCWRLFVVLLVGMLFIATTKTSQIKAAVRWFFAPIPFVSGRRLATMLSLVMRFIPVILNQARETAEAQKARCVENRKSPIYRLKKIGTSLLRRTFENADRLIYAMEARCYNENQTIPDLRFRPADWVVLIGMSVISALLIIV